MLSCKQCQKTFKPIPAPAIDNSPSVFDKPLYCEECSNQRRLCWFNPYSLYNRPCSNCEQDTIGMYKTRSNYQVYCVPCWQHRNNVSLGYDRQKPFWDQFDQLLRIQPLPSLSNDNNQQSSNCAFTNNVTNSKNCYFVFDGAQNQDCYYCYSLGESKNSADCSYCIDAELSYELINCHGCYHSAYLIDSRLTNDCYFCYDLSNCSNCLFSSGLRNQQYYIFNKPHTKEQYEEYMQTHVHTGSYSQWTQLISQYQDWLETVIRKKSTNRKSENCLGNDILYCKSASGFFIHKCEDCHNIINATTNKNVTNSIYSLFCELSSECLQMENCYASFGCAFCTNATSNFYSLYCQNCKHVFGCIGLQNQEYCILNKQYSKEEYQQLVKEIIKQLKEQSTFGQFFPPQLSPFSYYETIAQDLFPLSMNEAQKLGYHWLAEDSVAGTPYPSSSLADHINDTDQTITRSPLVCSTCSKKYLITEQELALYKNIQIPLPRKCFRCRQQDRMLRGPNFHLYQRNCSNCRKLIHTHYPVATTYQVYCEDCYTQLVIIS